MRCLCADRRREVGFAWLTFDFSFSQRARSMVPAVGGGPRPHAAIVRVDHASLTTAPEAYRFSSGKELLQPNPRGLHGARNIKD